MNDYRARAALLKAIAHPMRLRIIDILRHSPECVCHLSAALEKPQPYVSQQLAILRNAGVIVDEREGANIFYRLADTHILLLAEAALGVLDCARADGASSYRQPVSGCNCPKCAADVT